MQGRTGASPENLPQPLLASWGGGWQGLVLRGLLCVFCWTALQVADPQALGLRSAFGTTLVSAQGKAWETVLRHDC